MGEGGLPGGVEPSVTEAIGCVKILGGDEPNREKATFTSNPILTVISQAFFREKTNPNIGRIANHPITLNSAHSTLGYQTKPGGSPLFLQQPT